MDVLPARTDASSLTATFKVFLTRVSLVERDQQIINTENIFLRQHKWFAEVVEQTLVDILVTKFKEIWYKT